jgi:hypothetical protein
MIAAPRAPSLNTLLTRADLAQSRADDAHTAAQKARATLHRRAADMALAALARRGVVPGCLIGFTDAKVARWYPAPLRFTGIEVYAARNNGGTFQGWRGRIYALPFGKNGRPLIRHTAQTFDLQDPRHLAKQVLLLKEKKK